MSMKCPWCGKPSHVYDTVQEGQGRYRLHPFTVRRYRVCPLGHRFRSFEEPEWATTVGPVIGAIEADR